MRKPYYIPTIEITSLMTAEALAWGLGGSGDHGQAPPRRSMPEGGDKAF